MQVNRVVKFNIFVVKIGGWRFGIKNGKKFLEKFRSLFFQKNRQSPIFTTKKLNFV